MKPVDWTSDKLDLYALFGVGADAQDPEIKRAYRKLALAHHPDRAENDQSAVDQGATSATHRFQVVAAAYSILSNPARRKVYDRTESIRESVADLLPDAGETDGLDYDLLFRRVAVTVADIVQYERTYRGSEAERKDVVANYQAAQGDMERFLKELQIGARFTSAEQDRYREIVTRARELDAAIPLFKSFFKANAAVTRRLQAWARREARAAERAEQPGADDGASDLALTLQQRSEQRYAALMASLDARIAQEASGRTRAGGKSKPPKAAKATPRRP